MKTVYYFVCEGKSEYAYLQELNRFFKEEGIPVYFCAVNANGGHPEPINNAIKILYKRERKISKIYVFLDMDLYYRGDCDLLRLSEKANILFNTWSFEDFLRDYLKIKDRNIIEQASWIIEK